MLASDMDLESQWLSFNSANLISLNCSLLRILSIQLSVVQSDQILHCRSRLFSSRCHNSLVSFLTVQTLLQRVHRSESHRTKSEHSVKSQHCMGHARIYSHYQDLARNPIVHMTAQQEEGLSQSTYIQDQYMDF